LGIKPGFLILIVNATVEYSDQIADIAPVVTFHSLAEAGFDFIHFCQLGTRFTDEAANA